MKTPRALQPLVEAGVVDDVIRQLPSGKEATVYVVACGDVVRCAKVYKDAEKRSFRKASGYREGRKARGSRDARAAGRGSRHGRKVQEEEWKNAEVDALYRLARADVCVPQPHGLFEGAQARSRRTPATRSGDTGTLGVCLQKEAEVLHGTPARKRPGAWLAYRISSTRDQEEEEERQTMNQEKRQEMTKFHNH